MFKSGSTLSNGAIVFALLILTGCAYDDQHAPSLGAPALYNSLLTGAGLVDDWSGEALAITQVVSGTANDRPVSGRLELEIRTGYLAIVGFTHAGIPLFEIVVTPGGVKSRIMNREASMIRPEWIVTDVILGHWPEKALRQRLSEVELDIDISGGERRIIDRAGKIQAMIQYKGEGLGPAHHFAEELQFYNYRQDYELTVRPVEIRELE
jgi:hypothetical protein